MSDLLSTLWPGDAIWQQEIWVNNGSGNGLLSDGNKPLPEPMLTNHQLGSVAPNFPGSAQDI